VATPRHHCDRRRPGLPGSWRSLTRLCPALGPRQDQRARPYGTLTRPPLETGRRLPQGGVFRGSITLPWHSLSTSRPAGCPDRTQDSLPAAGQALRDGIDYPQGSSERFQRCVLHRYPPFPGLAWRNFPHPPPPPPPKKSRPGCAQRRRFRWFVATAKGIKVLTLARPAERMEMVAPALSRLGTVKNAEPQARDAAPTGGSTGAEIGR
jgi:hypothetical protein